MLPFILAPWVPALYRKAGRRVGFLVAVVPVSLFVYYLGFLGELGSEPVGFRLPWIPLLGVDLSFALDGFGLLFALLITGIGSLVVIYSTYYLGPREDLGKFYLYILIFMGAMLGVVTADNIVLLYIFWEITSVASFLLIGFWHTREESRWGALKAMMITVLGGFGILTAAVLLYVVGGSFELSALMENREAVLASPLYVPIVLLLLLGAFTKSAQAPFHIWLPGAMAAPTPVSAYLHSATMVKAGIFLVGRMAPLLGGTPLWYYTVSAVGAVTVFLGAFLAIRQTDLKALLAYSTVSQLGLIMPMFAAGTEVAALAGAAHILNHATFKGALFMLVGIIDHETHTRDLRRLGGLYKAMPVTAVLTGIAALSMAGVWPLNGFVSKELIFEAMLHPPFGPDVWTQAFAVLAVLGSAMTTIYCLILAHRINFGKPRYGDAEHPHDPPAGMLLGPVLLVGLVVLLGVYPYIAEGPIFNAAASGHMREEVHGHVHNVPVPGMPLAMSLIALGLGLWGYRHLESVRRAFDQVRPRVHANAVYDGILAGLDRLSRWMVRVHMTGLLRDYIAYILLVVFLGIGLAAAASGAAFDLRLDLAPMTFVEAVVIALIIAGAIAVAAFRHRLAAIVALSIVGLMVSFLYVQLRAPDLALTQLMVESISTVLILLAVRYLPPLPKEQDTARRKAADIALAAGAGALVAFLALMTNANRLFPSISQYFVENSKPLGGGSNIVNVILVDFRGVDTMGEITVLGIAALSVYALVTLRQRTRGRAERPVDDPPVAFDDPRSAARDAREGEMP